MRPDLVHAVELHGQMGRDIVQAFPGQPVEVVLVVLVAASPLGEMSEFAHSYIGNFSHIDVCQITSTLLFSI